MDISALDLAVMARKSIGEYCFSECDAYCCRKGYIVLNAHEADLLTDMKKESMKMISDTEYLLELSLNKEGCARLKDNKCVIHTNPHRPDACKNYPLFIRENKAIKVSNRCPAVNGELLYPYLAKFKLMGYSLVYFDDHTTKIRVLEE